MALTCFCISMVFHLFPFLRTVAVIIIPHLLILSNVNAWISRINGLPESGCGRTPWCLVGNLKFHFYRLCPGRAATENNVNFRDMVVVTTTAGPSKIYIFKMKFSGAGATKGLHPDCLF